MLEEAGTMADFKALLRAGLLGELVAVELEDDQFSLIGVNPKTQVAVVMYNTQLTERRIWSGSRYVVGVARKLGVNALTFRIRTEPKPQPHAQAVKLPSGTVISH